MKWPRYVNHFLNDVNFGLLLKVIISVMTFSENSLVYFLLELTFACALLPFHILQPVKAHRVRSGYHWKGRRQGVHLNCKLYLKVLDPSWDSQRFSGWANTPPPPPTFHLLHLQYYKVCLYGELDFCPFHTHTDQLYEFSPAATPRASFRPCGACSVRQNAVQDAPPPSCPQPY